MAHRYGPILVPVRLWLTETIILPDDTVNTYQQKQYLVNFYQSAKVFLQENQPRISFAKWSSFCSVRNVLIRHLTLSDILYRQCNSHVMSGMGAGKHTFSHYNTQWFMSIVLSYISFCMWGYATVFVPFPAFCTGQVIHGDGNHWTQMETETFPDQGRFYCGGCCGQRLAEEACNEKVRGKWEGCTNWVQCMEDQCKVSPPIC